MSEQSPLPAPEQGDITVNSPVIGHVVVIGHDAQIQLTIQVQGVPDSTLHLDLENPLYQTLLQMLQTGTIQAEQLRAAGLSPEIVPPSLDAETLRSDNPFASPVGLPLPSVQNVDQVDQPFAALEQLLQQVDQKMGGTVQTISSGQQQLNPVELLLQQGHLAFWRFRQGATRLFAEQASLYYLAHTPGSTQPELQAFHTAAKSQLEVLRGWVFFQKYRGYRPAIFTPAILQDLSHGRWREGLESLVEQGYLSKEREQNEDVYLQAIGESYDAQQTQAAAEVAEHFFAEALRRHPRHSVALVNLGALKAEWAILGYIETGRADREQLQEARALLAQAQSVLADRPDAEGRLALAQSLLYEATSLPPDADLEAIQWAAQQIQHLRAPLSQKAQSKIRWGVLQRNVARRDPRLIDRRKLEQARDLLFGAGVGAGVMAAILLLCQQWLDALSQFMEFLQGGMEPRGGHLPRTPPRPPMQPTQPPKTTPHVPLGATLLRYTGHTGGIEAIAWSPDGQHIASGDSAGTVHIWNAMTGHRDVTYQGHVSYAAWRARVLTVAWSPDGTSIASGGDDETVHVWETTTGRKCLTYRGHNGIVRSAAWSPNGQYLLSGSSAGTAHLWEVKTGRPLFVDDPGGPVLAVAWSPVGGRVAWAKGETVWVLDGDGRFLSYQGHTSLVTSLAWSPDGHLLASASSTEGGVYLWEAANGQTRLVYPDQKTPVPRWVTCVAWSPDGAHLASGMPHEDVVQIWETATGKDILTYRGHASYLSAPRPVFTEDVITGGVADPATNPWAVVVSHSVRTLSWSPDGTRIASGGIDQHILVWQAG